MQIAFNHLPYRRPVLGPIDVISQLQPQQMRDFHATWYQPQSITAVAVEPAGGELIQIVADGFTEAINNRQPALDSESLSTLDPELPFTEIVRQEFVDDSLQQARLVMV